ncbi:hypothetical protein [Enterococcus diestrammenae]|uniref:hypothetical protein n=1 Tax=Enterococcus diestrammenae TaxID=1155073 RepID=UPI0022E3037C|nr:hypothetical protein [Enterococcus diestrammenae]
MREEKYTDMSLTDEQASLLGFKSLSMPEQYIQVKDARYTLDEFNRIGELLLGRNLTDDQQVVLDDLINYQSCADCSPFVTIFAVDSDYQSDSLGDKLCQAYEKLSDEQQFQVLAAFVEWGSKGGNQ